MPVAKSIKDIEVQRIRSQRGTPLQVWASSGRAGKTFNQQRMSEMSEKPIEDIDRDTMLNFVACTNTLVDNLRKGIQSGLASSAYTRILRFSK